MMILEGLYLGDVHPGERGFKHSSQYVRALHEAAETDDALIDTLDDQQSDFIPVFRQLCQTYLRSCR